MADPTRDAEAAATIDDTQAHGGGVIGRFFGYATRNREEGTVPDSVDYHQDNQTGNTPGDYTSITGSEGNVVADAVSGAVDVATNTGPDSDSAGPWWTEYLVYGGLLAVAGLVFAWVVRPALEIGANVTEE
jgi:hypothetical protein